jgi:hypothetical protein
MPLRIYKIGLTEPRKENSIQNVFIHVPSSCLQECHQHPLRVPDEGGREAGLLHVCLFPPGVGQGRAGRPEPPQQQEAAGG